MRYFLKADSANYSSDDNFADGIKYLSTQCQFHTATIYGEWVNVAAAAPNFLAPATDARIRAAAQHAQ